MAACWRRTGTTAGMMSREDSLCKSSGFAGFSRPSFQGSGGGLRASSRVTLGDSLSVTQVALDRVETGRWGARRWWLRG